MFIFYIVIVNGKQIDKYKKTSAPEVLTCPPASYPVAYSWILCLASKCRFFFFSNFLPFFPIFPSVRTTHQTVSAEQIPVC